MSLFDELLGEHGHHDHSNHQDWGRQPSRAHGDEHHGWGHGDRPKQHYGHSTSHGTPMLGQLLHNKGLLIGLGILAVIFLVIAIAVLTWALPFVSQLLGFASENGIKGLLEKIAPILSVIWNGTGK